MYTSADRYRVKVLNTNEGNESDVTSFILAFDAREAVAVTNNNYRADALPSLLRLQLLRRRTASVSPCTSFRLLEVPLLGVFGIVRQIRDVALTVVLLQSSKTTAAAAVLRVVVKLRACLTLTWVSKTSVYRS